MWRILRRYYALFLPIRLSFVALAVLVFAFWFADQGWDILRALAEDQVGSPKIRVLTFLAMSIGLALTIWFWSRHLLRFRPHAPADDSFRDRNEEPLVEEHPRATRWMPRVLGLFVFAIEIAGFALVARQYGDVQRPVPPKLVWIVALLVAEAAVYWIVVVYRRWIFSYSETDMFTTVRSWKEMDRSTRGALFATIVAEVLLFAWACIDPVSWWRLGAAAVLVLTIGVWMPIGSFLAALGERFRFPVLGFLVLWAVLISPLTDNHTIRTVPGGKATRVTMEEALTRWYARVQKLPQHADNDRPIPAIIVAAEGGGIRAAYWTASVLATLQDKIPTFADHCFAISGVSGGSLGAVVFDALLASRMDQAARIGGDLQPSLALATKGLQGNVREVLGFDALSGTLAALSQPDLLQRFMPPPWFPDRERALELGWEHGWASVLKGEQAKLLGDGFLATMDAHRELPQLFLNGTLVENGARIITSAVQLRSALVFRTAVDAFDQLRTDIPLSSAAGMSTRFTYVSPAGRIPGPDAKHPIFSHVIDGGYFENSGAVTASEIIQFIEQDSGRSRIRPVVIVIDHRKMVSRDEHDMAPFCPAPGVCGPGAPPKVERWANEVMSPVRGLLNTRDARGVMALGNLLHHVRRGDGDHDMVDFRLIPRAVPLPLGWVLSDGAMKSIDQSVDCEGGNRSAVAIVARWLAVSPPTPICRDVPLPIATPLPVECDNAGCTASDAAEMGERR